MAAEAKPPKPVFLSDASAGCAFVDPENVSRDEFIDDRHRELVTAHIENCELCQSRINGFRHKN
ncbi:hypothetical protein H0W80_01645 [Candidatus Saccharibacteria bacterium]|nr:hypothetical protein [Candidatus Saccharibacteria bacterium]